MRSQGSLVSTAGLPYRQPGGDEHRADRTRHDGFLANLGPGVGRGRSGLAGDPHGGGTWATAAKSRRAGILHPGRAEAFVPLVAEWNTPIAVKAGRCTGPGRDRFLTRSSCGSRHGDVRANSRVVDWLEAGSGIDQAMLMTFTSRRVAASAGSEPGLMLRAPLVLDAPGRRRLVGAGAMAANVARSAGLRLEEWRDQGRLTTIKEGLHRIVYKVQLAEGIIFVKHNIVPDYRAMFRQWFRRGKGRNEGNVARAGLDRRADDRAHRLGEQRKRKFLSSTIVTWEIPGSVAAGRVRGAAPERLARAAAIPGPPPAGGVSGRSYRAAARCGFFHIDFHPGNILVRVTPGDMPELFMIDLDALRRTRRCHGPGRVQSRHAQQLFWPRSGRPTRHRFLNRTWRTDRYPFPSTLVRPGHRRFDRAWAERLCLAGGNAAGSPTSTFRFKAVAMLVRCRARPRAWPRSLVARRP